MAPPVPAVGVTVQVAALAAKVADTVQAPVIAPVVYLLPESVPPHPVTEAIW